MMTPPVDPLQTGCGVPVKGGLPPPPQASTPLPPSSLVQPLETNPPRRLGEFIQYQKCGAIEFSIEPVTEAESVFRHSGWAPRREQIWAALQRTHAGDTRLARFANCGSGLWLEMNSAGDDVRLRCNHCHDRWCQPCQAARLLPVTEKLAAKLDATPSRFLTLTLRAGSTSLCAQIDRLYRCFSTLRRRKDWQSHVKGGCAFFETKLGEGSGLWHPHLHILIEGTWWDQKEISRAWHEVTGDSSIVFIKPVPNAGTYAGYVTKYVTKPADSSVFAQPAKLDELIIALKGRRLVLPFGTWRSLKLTEQPEPTDVWTPVTLVRGLDGAAGPLSSEDLRWRDVVTRKYPELARLFGWPTDSS